MNRSTPCPDGVMSLGFGGYYFPYVYLTPNERLSGIFVEIFSTVGSKFGCNKAKLIQFAQKKTNDVLYGGRVLTGEILSAIDGSYLVPSDALTYQYSLPSTYSQMCFVEKIDQVPTSTSLAFFLVFSWPEFILILIANLIWAGIEYQIKRRTNRRTDDLLSWALMTSLMCRQFYLFFLLALWNSFYSGNNVLVSPNSLLSLSEMLAQLRSGHRDLVSTRGDIGISADELRILIGRHALVTPLSVLESLRKVCDTTSVGLFYLSDIDFYQSSQLAESCTLAKILPRKEHIGVPWLDEIIRAGDPIAFLFPRSVYRQFVNAINNALLTVYAYDLGDLHLARLDYRSYLARAKYLEAIDGQINLEFRQMTMWAFIVPAAVITAGLLISILTFGLEQMVYRYVKGSFFKRTPNQNTQ